MIGSRHLSRADARFALAVQRAATAAQSVPEDRERWTDLYTILAGFRGR